MKLYNFFYCFLTALFLGEAIPAKAQKPNIIFILVDDLGYKALTVDGGNLFNTPVIDSLSNNGMRFTQCYSSPLCSPSRFLLLTGKYNFRNYYKWGVMDTSDRTIGNLFKNAGYKTGCFGKWQFGGGDTSIHALGFDEYTLHDALDAAQIGARYKNPHIYANGKFLPKSKIDNKYGPDITSDSLLKFIDKNKSVPFFIYYPMILTHGPFQPTPDDTAFANFRFGSDTAFFPSMVEYMDKEIGELMNKLQESGIDNNTILILTGDNGSPKKVVDYNDNGQGETGGKATTTSTGTHVPLIIYWPGKIAPGSINNDLIDFTDFLPTFAGIANISIPKDLVIDGIDFSPRLTGGNGTPRSWIFDYFNHDPSKFTDTDTTRRFAQTDSYKLYDTSRANNQLLFYNIIDDPEELKPIPDNLLTTDEINIKNQLLSVIKGYVLQGFSVMADPLIEQLSLTDSSVTIADSIKIDGGSTISANGVVWSTKENPVLSAENYTSDISYKGRFSSNITSLTPNNTYYVRTYATNKAGTAYSKQISFTTPPKAPIATSATGISKTEFTAHWNALSGVKNYRVDVSTLPNFGTTKQVSINEEFNNGIVPPEGWTFTPALGVNNQYFGKDPPSIQYLGRYESITTNVFSAPATNLTFWIKALKGDGDGTLIVEGFDGFMWTVLDNVNNIPTKGITKAYDSASANWKSNFIQFRISYSKNLGNVVIDDIHIEYPMITYSFVTNYKDTSVNGDSLIVTGLQKGKQYYYRVRAVNENDTSGYSNTISESFCSQVPIQDIQITNVHCSVQMSGAINVTVQSDSLNYQWTGPNNFTSTKQDINKLDEGAYHLAITSNEICAIDTTIIVDNDNSNCNNDSLSITYYPNPSSTDFSVKISTNGDKPVQLFVTDLYGKKLYKTSGNADNLFVFGRNFAVGTYFLRVIQGDIAKTVMLIKTVR